MIVARQPLRRRRAAYAGGAACASETFPVVFRALRMRKDRVGYREVTVTFAQKTHFAAFHVSCLEHDRAGRPPLGETSTARESCDQTWSQSTFTCAVRVKALWRSNWR